MNFRRIMMTRLISVITLSVGLIFSIAAMNGNRKYSSDNKNKLCVNKKNSNKENYYFEQIYSEFFNDNNNIAQEVSFEKCAGECIAQVSKLLDEQYKTAGSGEKNDSSADEILNNVWQEYANFNSGICKAYNNRFSLFLELNALPKTPRKTSGSSEFICTSRPRKTSGSGEYVITPRPNGEKKQSYHIPVLATYKLGGHLSRNEIGKAQDMLKDPNVVAYVKHYVRSYGGHKTQESIELDDMMDEAIGMIRANEQNAFQRRITNK